MQDFAHAPQFPARDRHDLTTDKLPVVILVFLQRDRVPFQHGQLVTDKFARRFRRVVAGELQNDPPRVQPTLFERERAARACGRDGDQLGQILEAFGEVGQKLCRHLAA